MSVETYVFQPDSNITFLTHLIFAAFMWSANGFTICGLLAFMKTRAVPKTAKFLSCGLLIFDSSAIFLLNIRKFFTGIINIHIIAIAYTLSFLAYMNIIFMSCDRYLILSYPFRYIRMEKVMKPFVVFSWSFYSLTMLIICYVKCFGQYTDPTSLVKCNVSIYGRVVLIIFPLIMLLSMFFFVKVLIVIYNVKCSEKRAIRLRDFKSTTVMLCCVVNFVTVALVCFLSVLIPMDDNVRRMFGDAVFTANGVFDTLAYVLIFRECRMIFMRLLGFFSSKAKIKAENMRIEIFNIVPSSKKHELNSLNTNNNLG